jgi:ketosteroid isomerase-like protein
MFIKCLAGVWVVAIMACQNTTPVDWTKEKEAIIKTDLAFSDLSRDKGMKAAFLMYMDSSAVLLRRNHLPIVGKETVQYLQAVPDSSFILTWQPDTAILSASGDLGYTYGLYTLKEKDTTIRGTYVSIWKKQRDGSWKYVLDTGNQGLGEK